METPIGFWRMSQGYEEDEQEYMCAFACVGLMGRRMNVLAWRAFWHETTETQGAGWRDPRHMIASFSNYFYYQLLYFFTYLVVQ